MSAFETSAPQSVPSISFDAHFANVPHLEEVKFDATRCAELLTHPVIGLDEDDLSRLHLYVRPDYKLAYTRAERREAKRVNPEDYDDAASTEMLSKDGPLGRRGDILVTLVYGSGFGVNKLLCHEAVHARVMLQQNTFGRWRDSFTSMFLPEVYNRDQVIEEAKADWAMDDIALKGLRKNVIEIITNSRS